MESPLTEPEPGAEPAFVSEPASLAESTLGDEAASLAEAAVVAEPAPVAAPAFVAEPAPAPGPERILVRLRRLGTLFRALLITQITAGLLLLVLGLLEWNLPGVLPQLFRGRLDAAPVLGSLAGLLLVLDLASAVTELKMGRSLGVARTPLRRVITVLSFVPGLLLLRRLLVLVLAALWLTLLFAMLVLWVALLLLLGLPLWAWAGLNRGLGRLVDLVDLGLSELHALASRGLAALAVSPVHRVGQEEDAVLQLLHRRRPGADGRGSETGGSPPAGAPPLALE